MKDLVALVADKKMEAALRALLRREANFGIRPITEDVFRHPRHDPGVLLEAHEFLQVFRNTHQHALVMFDLEGCGRGPTAADALQVEVQERLDQAGWGGCSGVVVLDPELEVWVWSDSPHVADVLGMPRADLQRLVSVNTPAGRSKPIRPKELMGEVLRRSRVPLSASLYSSLARQVGVARCTDRAFLLLRELLSRWFPA